MRSKGVTLIEAAVVLGIVAIVAAIGWQSQALRARYELRSAATQLVADLRAAQTRAIGEPAADRAHGVEFPASGDRYVVMVDDGQTRIPVREHLLPAGVRITYAVFGGTDPASVWFTGTSLLGAPSGGGTVTFTSRGVRVCIRVLPATGRVRLAQTGCP